MITKIEQQALKSLMQDKRWDVVQKLHGQFITRWQADTGIGLSEFETLKLTFTKEGRIDGLDNFFESLDDEAQRGAEE